MRVDNQTEVCNRDSLREFRWRRPAWGSQTIKHSRGKWAGIWPNGVCRAIEPGAADGRLAFLSLRAADKEARKLAVIAHRYTYAARYCARKLP